MQFLHSGTAVKPYPGETFRSTDIHHLILLTAIQWHYVKQKIPRPRWEGVGGGEITVCNYFLFLPSPREGSLNLMALDSDF